MIVILDTETTGLDTKSCEIIEIATCPLGDEEVQSILIRPVNPIPNEVIEITGITNEMVASEPTLEEALPKLLEMLHLDEDPIFVAHNAPFDMGMVLHNLMRVGFEQSDLTFMDKSRWLCTNRLSKITYGADPKCRSTKLTEMQKFCNLHVPENNIAHRAGADVLTCMRLLEHFLEKYQDLSIEELNELCWGPIQYTRFPFGMHKGKLLERIPTDYFIWLFENINSLNPEDPNFDADLYGSIENEINRRIAAMAF